MWSSDSRSILNCITTLANRTHLFSLDSSASSNYLSTFSIMWPTCFCSLVTLENSFCSLPFVLFHPFSLSALTLASKKRNHDAFHFSSWLFKLCSPAFATSVSNKSMKNPVCTSISMLLFFCLYWIWPIKYKHSQSAGKETTAVHSFHTASNHSKFKSFHKLHTGAPQVNKGLVFPFYNTH